MTNFSFDNTIPATNNNPSNDQPGMLINNQSTQSILGVDHITFGIDNGGTHLQQQYVDTTSFTALPTDVSGIAYPGNDTQNIMNMYFVNSTNFLAGVAYPLPMSIIKAGGLLVASQGSSSLTYNFNCVSVSYAGAGVYEITLRAGIVQGSNVLVFLSFGTNSTNLSARWAYSSNVLSITSNTAGTNTISFIVLQF